jgi:hypothetical protein
MIGAVIDAPRLFSLQRRCGETSGEITHILPRTHGLIEVRYVVSGVAFKQALQMHNEIGPVTEGAHLTVYYSTNDPRVAFTEPPADILTEQLPAWIMGSLLVSTAITLGIFLLWRSDMPQRRLSIRVSSPKIISLAATIGLVSGLTSAVYSGTVVTGTLVGGGFILCGCGTFLVLAWRRKLSWRALARSAVFWIAFALVVIGNLFDVFLR